jgi:1-acyl-sn-glycerol-3-phosphate acyltransferase
MIRGIFTFIVMIVSTAILGTLATIGSLLRRQSDISIHLARLWSRLNLAATGLRPEYSGLENASKSTPCIFLANHQSTLDIWLLLMILPFSTRFVAKDSLFRLPILGWALRASGFIPIDRSNRTSALRSLEKAVNKIRDGRSIVLFPEGTRSRDGRMGRFKKGAFYLALKAGVPVVPVSLRGTFNALPPGMYRIHKGPVVVRVHPPIDVAPYLPDDIKGLSSIVRATIIGGLEENETMEPSRATGAMVP